MAGQDITVAKPTSMTRTPWPGKATARDLSRDTLTTWQHNSLGSLLSDQAHMERVTAALLAGTPADVPLAVQWSHHNGSVTLEAHDAAAKGQVIMGRVFTPYGDGTWEVDHVCFKLAERFRGSGAALRMMRASVEVYDTLNVLYARTFANYLNGGYVWAKVGFAADRANHIRDLLQAELAAAPDDVLYQSAVRVADETPDDELMYALARLPGTGGRELLEGQQWYAHLNLADERHRRRLASTFDE